MDGAIKVVKTVGEIIEALGGDAKVARRLGLKDGRTVWNWRARGNFPPRSYLAWQKILNEEKISAPAELWKQKQV